MGVDDQLSILRYQLYKMKISLRNLKFDLLRIFGSRLMLTAGYERKRKLLFRIGLVLILVSYALWGAMFVFGTLALRDTGSSWWPVASAAFILSWVIFAAGLCLAGIETSRIVRLRFFRFSRR